MEIHDFLRLSARSVDRQVNGMAWSSVRTRAVMLLNVINSAVREGDRNARAMTGVAKKRGSIDRYRT